VVISISFHVVDWGVTGKYAEKESAKIREQYEGGQSTGLFKSASVQINFN